MWSEEDGMMDIVEEMGQARISSPARCPICDKATAHYLMHRDEGMNGRGTAWIWCDSCESYAHFGYFVPAWWENPGFVDAEKLDSFVEYPHSIENRIDEWVNALLRN